MNNYLQNMTQEQRAAMREKAQASRQAANKHAQETYYTWPLSEGHWLELASKYNVRLPVFSKKATGQLLYKYARQLGLSDGTWEEAMFGVAYTTGNSVAGALRKEALDREGNLKYNARCYVGHLLELRESNLLEHKEFLEKGK